MKTDGTWKERLRDRVRDQDSARLKEEAEYRERHAVLVASAISHWIGVAVSASEVKNDGKVLYVEVDGVVIAPNFEPVQNPGVNPSEYLVVRDWWLRRTGDVCYHVAHNKDEFARIVAGYPE